MYFSFNAYNSHPFSALSTASNSAKCWILRLMPFAARSLMLVDDSLCGLDQVLKALHQTEYHVRTFTYAKRSSNVSAPSNAIKITTLQELSTIVDCSSQENTRVLASSKLAAALGFDDVPVLLMASVEAVC